MRIWTIEGADKETGKERIITIEALTQDEAVKEAGAAGLLVSAVHELPPAPPKPRPANPTAPTGKARYTNITRGAGTLEVVASILMVIGWLCVAGGALCVVMGIGESSVGMSITAGIGVLINGVVMVVAAVLINMLSALALAIRDIAINSAK